MAKKKKKIEKDPDFEVSVSCSRGPDDEDIEDLEYTFENFNLRIKGLENKIKMFEEYFNIETRDILKKEKTHVRGYVKRWLW